MQTEQGTRWPAGSPPRATPTATRATRWLPRAGPLRDGLLLVALLLTVLAATTISYNTSLPVVIRVDDNLRHTFDSFHAVEHNEQDTYRWTTGASSLCVAQFGHASSLARVSLLGQGALPLGINEVTLLANQTPLATLPLAPATRHYSVLVSPQQQASSNLCITIASDTVQPAGELRQLGVPFQGFELRRLTDAGLVLPAGLQLVLNLALAGLAFVLLRLVGLPGWLAALLPGGLALLVGLGVRTEMLVPGMHVTRNTWPLLALLALLVASVAGLRLGERRGWWQASWLQPQLARDLLLMGLWSGVLYGGVFLLQAISGRHGVWPLKAGVWPGFTPLVLLAGAAFAVWLALLLRRLAHDPPGQRALLFGLLLAGAVVLPVLLKVSVRGWETLYYTFSDNPSDYIHDVPLVGSDPLGFLGSYVERSPTLAWHNANHPPGSVLMLWAVAGTLGPGAVPASWVAIVLTGLGGTLAAFWLGGRLGGPHIALLAGALYVVMPVHQVYSVTSMDGIFNALNALAAVAFFLALEPGARPWRGLLAGALIALALFFSYVTTQLFFLGLAVCGLALVRGQSLRFVLRQGALTVAVLVGLYLLLYLISGFNIIEASIQAKANNARLLGDPTETNPGLMGLPTITHYITYLGVNIVPFLWYLAPWGLAALTPVLLVALRGWRAPASQDVLAISLLVLVLGMWGSGLFIREVERIWGFVYPLAAVLMAAHIWQGESTRVRLWRAGLYVSLFFAQAAVMRMLLNTYW